MDLFQDYLVEEVKIDNNMNESLQNLIATLQKKGYLEEEIASLCDQVIASAYEEFFQEAESLMTPEQKERMNVMPETEASLEELSKMYAQQAGRDPHERLGELLKKHTEELLKDYEEPESAGTSQ